MKIRRWAAVLACVLLLSALCPVSAAPARDAEEISAAEYGDLQGLLSVIMSAAMLRDETSLAAGQAPGDGLVQAAFAVFEYNMQGVEQVTLTEQSCAELYDSLFAAGSFVMPEKGDCPCVVIEDGKMRLDLQELNETPLVGAWVYSAREENGVTLLDMDLYTAWGYYTTPALDIPEEDLTWYRHCRAAAVKSPESVYGWRLSSFEMGQIYADGAFSAWGEYANEEAGYSVMIPSLMGLGRDSADDVLFETADAEASVRIETLPPMTAGEAKAYAASLESGETAEDDMFCVIMHVSRRQAVIIMYESAVSAYRVTLSYPEERMEEYALYAQIMRNSFTIRGLSNG